MLREVAALYRGSVDIGEHDDFRELSDLLFGAKDRYRSARATISHTVEGTVAEESNRRFVDWRFAQGNPGMGIIGKPGPPVREDFYHEYEDTEMTVRLWHERPDRWREDWLGTEGAFLRCVVAAGRHVPLWIYEPPHTAIHVPSVPERRKPDPDFAFMLDPSEEVVCDFGRQILRAQGKGGRKGPGAVGRRRRHHRQEHDGARRSRGDLGGPRAAAARGGRCLFERGGSGPPPYLGRRLADVANAESFGGRWPRRLILGFAVGAFLGAALSAAVDPLILFFPDIFPDSGGRFALLFLLALLSWAAAFAIGFLSARIAGGFEVPVAAVSVWLGSAIVQSVGGGLPLFGIGVLFYGGIYPILALFGGAIAYARRHEGRG